MKDCIFCHRLTQEQILYQSQHFKLVLDINPIQTGHLLLISKDHYQSLADLPRPVLHDLIETQAYLVKQLEELLPIDGVTSASNDKNLMDPGTHFHVHLIPRVQGDGFWDRLEIAPLPLDLGKFLADIT